MRLKLDFLTSSEKRRIIKMKERLNIPCTIESEKRIWHGKECADYFIDRENFKILKKYVDKEFKTNGAYRYRSDGLHSTMRAIESVLKIKLMNNAGG